MLKKSTSWCVLIYGLILIGLGYWGYHKGGSITSFYAGGGFGALLVLSSLFMFAQKRFGAYSALTLTLLLTGLFGIRYSITHKNVPAILAVLSGAMLLFLMAQTARWKKN
jgi:uncharacterized membrane protein (UPF0136 family)